MKKKAMVAIGICLMALVGMVSSFTPAATAKAEAGGRVTVICNAAKKKKKIKAAAAKKKALKNAKLSADEVTFTKTKLDKDDGVYVYEIEFYTSSKEYEYEINAYSGKVVKKEVKKIKNADSEKYIGAAKAKKIALNHAKLSETEVDYIKAKLDKDDGEAVYEVEFLADGIEYEYTIEAYTGEIMEFESDYDD